MVNIRVNFRVNFENGGKENPPTHPTKKKVLKKIRPPRTVQTERIFWAVLSPGGEFWAGRRWGVAPPHQRSGFSESPGRETPGPKF